MSDKWLPPEEWVKTIHRIPYASGCMIRDPKGRILAGKVARTGHWTIPGGMGEKGESPRTTAIRETQEEIGVCVRKLRLLCTHNIRDKPESLIPDRLQFIFDGAMLTARQVAALHVPSGSEWEDFKFVSFREGRKILSPDLSIKLPRLLKALRFKVSLYIETQGEKVLYSSM